MSKYTVCYVDGHDMKYHTFTTEAEGFDDAIAKLREFTSVLGDFDHMICDVFEGEADQTMRVVLDVGATMPSRAHETDAGLDLFCIRGGIVWPWGSRVFDTGVHIELPPGTWGKIESKSGLNVKRNIVSCGGTIDEGYTGSIKVKLYNLGWKPYRFRDGDKIAQLVILPYIAPELEWADSLEETARGDSGFGSTGR